jgi:hypothetical protein
MAGANNLVGTPFSNPYVSQQYLSCSTIIFIPVEMLPSVECLTYWSLQKQAMQVVVPRVSS